MLTGCTQASSKCVSLCIHCPSEWMLILGFTGSHLPEYRTFALNRKISEIPLTQSIFQTLLSAEVLPVFCLYLLLTFPVCSFTISLESSWSFGSLWRSTVYPSCRMSDSCLKPAPQGKHCFPSFQKENLCFQFLNFLSFKEKLTFCLSFTYQECGILTKFWKFTLKSLWVQAKLVC